MSHGINANVVHRWRQLAREGNLPVPTKTGEFISVPLAAPPVAVAVAPADIRVELRRAAIALSIT